jgi:hypothetical protein
MSQVAVTSRLVEWFMSQPELFKLLCRAAIHRGSRHNVARMIMQRMDGNSEKT